MIHLRCSLCDPVRIRSLLIRDSPDALGLRESVKSIAKQIVRFVVEGKYRRRIRIDASLFSDKEEKGVDYGIAGTFQACQGFAPPRA
jgi:hypothetical protein